MQHLQVGPGQAPSSLASRCLVCSNQRSASACLPDTYRARMSCPASRSSAGCAAACKASSEARASCWPCRSLMSLRSSSAAIFWRASWHASRRTTGRRGLRALPHAKGPATRAAARLPADRHQRRLPGRPGTGTGTGRPDHRRPPARSRPLCATARLPGPRQRRGPTSAGQHTRTAHCGPRKADPRPRSGRSTAQPGPPGGGQGPAQQAQRAASHGPRRCARQHRTRRPVREPGTPPQAPARSGHQAKGPGSSG